MVKTRDNNEFKRIYDLYFLNIYRYAFLIVKKQDDSADIAQDVFLKFYVSTKEFNDEQHIKAWLLSCAHNAVMDYYRSKMRHNVSLDTLKDQTVDFKIDETLGHLLELPQKYKEPIYMHYYEGYTTQEIAKMLNRAHATVRTQLKRGRELLKITLE